MNASLRALTECLDDHRTEPVELGNAFGAVVKT